MTALQSRHLSELMVHLDAVAANTRLLAGCADHELMAVVKADGFGLGAAAVARVALTNGASWLGVTSLHEAAELRADGFSARMLSWLNPPDAAWVDAALLGIDVAVPSLEHLARIMLCLTGAPRSVPALRVHLHADVGLARDGAPESDWPAFMDAAAKAESSGLVQIVGLMGHLARADAGFDVDGCDAFVHFLRIARQTGLRAPVRSLAATSATLHHSRSHFDLCRVGAGLVGIDPSGRHRLNATATLTAVVVDVRDVPDGTGVGYGHVDGVDATRLATLGIGYADAIPREWTTRPSVYLGGVRCPIVGRVSMDMTTVDVGAADIRVGDIATVFGPGDRGEPTLEEWATWCSTIPHTLITGIGPRVHRRHFGATWPEARA